LKPYAAIVELEVEPEPTPEEQAAIEQALAAADPGLSGSTRGAWWQAGVDEALSPEPGQAARDA
jgi:hypothetical protein